MAKRRKRKFTADVYMPLVMGDFLRQTSGMRAEVRGVYLRLLIHQWDKGFISADVNDLELIDSEVNKVWFKLKDKFIEFEPGKLRNSDLEEVRAFFRKQSGNAKKANDKPSVTPTVTPKVTPNDTPKDPPHNESDIESEFKYQYKESKIDFSKPDVPEDTIIFPLDTGPVRALWSKWKEYRWGEHQLQYGFMGEQAALKQLEGLDYPRIEGIIMKAIEAKWQNLYPEKQNGASKTTRKGNINGRREGFAKRYGSGAGSE